MTIEDKQSLTLAGIGLLATGLALFGIFTTDSCAIAVLHGVTLLAGTLCLATGITGIVAGWRE